ncbi:hypothetical protein ACFDR9_001233 [Janthinobacterium sp. CG_23.3]|uniref:hypothetical protein n=1 Tax=Janthinobacterium sp. CG_23.3 TaxID=3349634 RepID=UPI0038D44468
MHQGDDGSGVRRLGFRLVPLEPAPAPRVVALLTRKGAYQGAAAQAFAALAASLAEEGARAALLAHPT